MELKLLSQLMFAPIGGTRQTGTERRENKFSSPVRIGMMMTKGNVDGE